MKNSDFAAVLIVIVVAASAVGGFAYYFRNNPTSPIISPANTQQATSTQQPTTANSCNSALPLTLVGVKVQTINYSAYTMPALSITWANCANQDIKFNVENTLLNVTIVTYGKTSVVAAYLGGQVFASVQAHSTSTVAVPFVLPPSASPNAVIQNVKGILVAQDPVTGQAISTKTSISAP